MKLKGILMAALAATLAACEEGDPTTGPTGGADCSACLDPQILDVLTTHAHDLAASASLLSGHPSAREMVCFFTAPGLTGDDAVPATFITPVESCSSPLQFDPFCEGNLCSRLACTGEGAGWVVSFWHSEAASFSGFRFESAGLDCTWMDGAAGIRFALRTSANDATGRRWDVTGSGTMDPNALSATETFPALCPRGALTLTVRSTPTEDRATLSLGGLPIAELDASGKLVSTSSCR